MLFTEHFLSFFSYVNTVLLTESIFHMLFLWVYVYTYMYIHVTEEKDNVTNLNLTPSNIPVVISEGQTVVSWIPVDPMLESSWRNASMSPTAANFDEQ